MAFTLYLNDDDLTVLVAALTAASTDATLTNQQRNFASAILSAGLSAYANAPLLPGGDPRATGDPTCRAVPVTGNRTVNDLYTVLNVIKSKPYGAGVQNPEVGDATWRGSAG